MTTVRAIVVTALVAVAVVAGAAVAGSASEDTAVVALQADGAALYQTHCAACHQADGAGIPGAFPPLAGNPSVADAAYVKRAVTEGVSGQLEVLGVTYDGVMPPLSLSDDELSAIVAFVQTLGGGSTPTTTTAAPPAGGDAAHGKDLFKGTGFANGGASCQGCHSAGSIGFRGGSGLGPDLTAVYDRLGGEAGLTAWLSAPPSQTMQPLFADKPLTTDEIADLSAFFASVADDDPAGGVDLLIVFGVVGLLVLLGVMGLARRRPVETYTQRLRSKK